MSRDVAHFVPQAALSPMDELREWIIEHARRAG